MRRTAFTVLELLVVVAIIGVLAAILFPVMAQAKATGKRTVCASNMRQIGLGLRLYADDFDGQMPLTRHDTPAISSTWIFSLRPYLSNVDEIRICPADPKGARRLKANGTSYVLNEYVVARGQEGAITNLDALPAPSSTITTFTISDLQGVTSAQDHTHSTFWMEAPVELRWNLILRDIQPDRHPVGGSPNGVHTNGSANYLFADTHVKAYAANQVKSWADRGDNFAKPPAN